MKKETYRRFATCPDFVFDGLWTEIVKSTIPSINLDPVLKKEYQALFKDLGMDLTTAVTIFLRQSVREQTIPFAIKRGVTNDETVAALEEYYDMKANPEHYKRYDSFSDARNEARNA